MMRMPYETMQVKWWIERMWNYKTMQTKGRMWSNTRHKINREDVETENDTGQREETSQKEDVLWSNAGQNNKEKASIQLVVGGWLTGDPAINLPFRPNASSSRHLPGGKRVKGALGV